MYVDHFPQYSYFFYSKILLRENEKAFINTVTGRELRVHFHWFVYFTSLSALVCQQSFPQQTQTRRLNRVCSWTTTTLSATSRVLSPCVLGTVLLSCCVAWRTLSSACGSHTEKVNHRCLNFSMWVSHGEGESQVSKL